MEKDRFASVKYCLFSRISPLWQGDHRRNFIALLRTGKTKPTVYSNARDLFDLLMRGVRGGIDSLDRQSITELLSDHEFVQVLWDVATSRPIQYRMQMSFIDARKVLIQHGAPESSLPLTRELQARAQEEAQRQQATRNAGGTVG